MKIENNREQRIMQKVMAMHKIAMAMHDLSHSTISRVGCVIFTADFHEVLAVAYNGPPKLVQSDPSAHGAGQPSGELHAEVNALIKMRDPRPLQGRAIMIITREPCVTCAKYIVNASNRIGGVIVMDHAEKLITGFQNGKYAVWRMYMECANIAVAQDSIPNMIVKIQQDAERWKS